MSGTHKPRRAKWAFIGRGPNGRELCRCGCGREVPKGRQTTCSTKCIDDWKAHNDPQTIRWLLWERDKEVCALCGRDTRRLRADYEAAVVAFGAEMDRKYPSEYRRAWPLYWTQVRSINHGNPALPRPPEGFPADDRTWWEADHIVPVVEGGGQCGPEGYRTLCCACHKAETRALAARRAERRRTSKQPELKLAPAILP